MRHARGNWLRPPRSLCQISGVLDVVDGKWMLLAIRELFLNRRHYGDLLASPEMPRLGSSENRDRTRRSQPLARPCA